ncbi:hypothetical protein BgiMline_001871 [Biomphalaria glabrata]|nr:hypothetical protein BgiMline_001746 [Biomphalaria glabrata]
MDTAHQKATALPQAQMEDTHVYTSSPPHVHSPLLPGTFLARCEQVFHCNKWVQSDRWVSAQVWHLATPPLRQIDPAYSPGCWLFD